MNNPHWQYYLTLDADLEEASRYVEISPNNFKTYSVEFVRMLLAAGSEIDVVARLLCKQLMPSSTADNIDDYRKLLTAKFPRLATVKVSADRYAISLTPWESWEHGKNPSWWKSHANVKHHRDSQFPEASLENVLNAIGGLCILVLYMYHDHMPVSKLRLKPRVLFLDAQYECGGHLLRGSDYRLPDFPNP